MTDVWNRIELFRGDITQVASDAIVNAANTTLLGGGGVDAAIHRAAGPQLVQECRTLEGCQTGCSKITKGYELPARFVIHTVGPVYRDGRHGEPDLLKSCYESSLRIAVENGLKSVAFPAISCGVFGYPVSEAARIALATTRDFLDRERNLEKVAFVLFDAKALLIYERAREAIRQKNG